MAGYLELKETFPKSGELYVSTTRDIILDWSADINTAQFQDANQLAQKLLLINEATNLPVTLTYSSYTARQRRLTLTATLAPSTKYRLIIRKGILDSSGRSSILDYTVHFETAASPISSVSLLNPSDGISLEAEPYVFNWSQPSSSGQVSFLLKFYENSALVGTFTTSATGVALVEASYSGVLGNLDGRRLAWEVTSRVESGTGYVLAAPSTRRSVFFGAYAEPADETSARTYSYNTQTVPAVFAVENYIPEHLSTNLLTFPSIQIDFTEAPATGTMLSFLEVTRKEQLPRNDLGFTYAAHTVSGDWTLSNRTLTFTPTETVDFNLRYEIKVLKGLRSVSGRMLSTTTSFQFCSQYNPYYVDIRAIKSKIRSEAATMSDDLINYHIYNASLAAKSRYYTWLYSVPLAGVFGDMIQEQWVREGGNLKSFGVLKWVEACTLYEIYNSILVDEIRNVGRTRRLADFQEALTADFVKGIEAAKKTVKEEMEYWDDFIVGDGVPMSGIRQYNYDNYIQDGDHSLQRVIKQRNDDF